LYVDILLNKSGWNTTDGSKEFNFYSVSSASPNISMNPPKNEDGSIAMFNEEFDTNLWCRLPSTMGNIEIAFGVSEDPTYHQGLNILFRNLTMDIYQSINSSSDIDLS
jgi:hypothetical protein